MALVALIVAGTPASAAFADEPKAPAPSADAVAQARGHFLRGVKLYEEDDFRAALIEFNRAYELAPNWAVLYNVGQSYYQLRDYANALRVLESYETLGATAIPGDRRSQVDREIEELRGRVAHVAIASNVAGATVTIDDAAIGESPLAAPHIVGAGRHAIRLSKPGYVTASKVVDIAGGDNLDVTLDLAPLSRAPEAAAARPSLVPALVSVAVGGAGVVAGSVFGVLALNDKSSLQHECRGTACPTSAQGDIDAFSRDGTISTVGFVVGGAGIGAAVVLYLTERRGRESVPPPSSAGSGARLEVRPWFLGTSGGVLGRF
jgi:hypothetical protein